MKFPSAICWLIAASLFMPLTAQDTKKLEKEPNAAELQAQIESLIGKLGAERYTRRRDAQRKLAELGPDALEALREAAENHDDIEVRWRARDLIEEINSPQPEVERDENERSDRLPRSFLRARGRDERWADLLDRFNMDLDPSSFDDFGKFGIQMRDLRQQMDEMNRRLESQLHRLQFDGQGFSSSGTSIKTGTDGVRVEIRGRDEDGKEETKVYEAPDMEAFREKFPEIAEQYLKGGGVFVFGPDDMRLRSLDLPVDRFRGRPRRLEMRPWRNPVVAQAREGERLGVSVESLAPEVAAFLGLEAGQGLVVTEITTDSLAESLGLKAGDVVYEINGEAIFSPTDVAKVLRGIARGEDVRAKVNRKGSDLELEGSKLVDAEKPELKKLDSPRKPKKSKAVIR